MCIRDSKITDIHEGLYGETDLRCTDQLPLDEIDILFFCTADGDTKKFMERHNIPEDLKIIDLSMDYRCLLYTSSKRRVCAFTSWAVEAIVYSVTISPVSI